MTEKGLPAPGLRYENVESAAIDLLRFPMAVLVVVNHSCPSLVPMSEADFPLLSGEGIFTYISCLIAYVIGRVAVPTFFMISGYLFFRNIPLFNARSFAKKMKGRLRTRIIPYVLWNILPFGICLLYATIGMIYNNGNPESIPDNLRHATFWGIIWDINIWGDNTNFFGLPTPNCAPYNAPLWFMRDLIVSMALSPLVYLIVRRLPFTGLAFLFASMYLHLWPFVPGLGAYAMFYYTLGAYFAIRRKSIVAFAIRFKVPVLILAIVLALFCAWFNGAGTPTGEAVFPFFQLFAVFSFFLIAAEAVKRGHRPFRSLIPACFFLYALHAAPLFAYRGWPAKIINQFYIYLFGTSSPAAQAITFFLTATTTIIFCLGVYVILHRTLPRVARVLTGRRR
ncbi:MAG: acyltransferase [Muribaculaceae bacterium]|nr:acyltransferase [Muribaculaceae bacterium]